MTEQPIAVTLLTGFLGSGKTTLVNRILADRRFHDTAVVVNEFGEIGLDGALIEHSREQLVQVTTGCLCCTIRGDIRETLKSLLDRRERGDIPPFRRLIVETTGLADPAPVIHTLMNAPGLARYMLAGVVTAVDGINGARSLDSQAESVKQVAVADRIVITKTDMIREPESQVNLNTLRARLADLNPGARILEGRDPSLDLQTLFETSLYDPMSKSMDVRHWLNIEAYDHHHDHHHEHQNHEHDHHGHDHHDINRHGTDIEAFSLVRDESIGTLAFTLGLELLLASRGEDLLRVKGIVNLLERPGKPVVIHGVQHVFHDPAWLDAWPDDDHRTKIVFITRNIPKSTVEAFFAASQSAENEHQSAARRS